MLTIFGNMLGRYIHFVDERIEAYLNGRTFLTRERARRKFDT